METITYLITEVCQNFEGYGKPKQQSQYEMLEDFLEGVQNEFRQDLLTEEWNFTHNEDGSVDILNRNAEPVFTAHFDTDGSIHSIVLNEQYLATTIAHIPCNMCGEGTMLYDPLPNSEAMGEDIKGHKVTHLYICDSCPAVALEFYNSKDTDCIAEAFKPGNGM